MTAPAIRTGIAAALALCLTGNAWAATQEPAPVLASSLQVKLSFAGQAGLPGRSTNLAEPVVIGGDLYVVDQGARTISIARAGGPVPVLDESSLPAEVSLAGGTGIVNMAGDGDRAFVVFHSETLPAALGTPAPLPGDAAYRIDVSRYDIVYAYDRAPNGMLSNPVPLTAFDATINGHRGGGMLVLPDGRLLYARGDNLNQNYDGLSAPQDPTSTLSKLLIVDGDTGSVDVAAMGLRNVQRITWADTARTRILFSDIGWTVAEEINELSVADLTDTATVENFGWGRNGDGLAREGTFYVAPGPESATFVTGTAPSPEAGFAQPFAQFGREDRDGLFAVSGPATSLMSFSRIGALFGDLPGGELFATLAGAEGTINEVFAVTALDESGQAKTLQALFGVSRVDLRLFNFADGGAGLMSERTGGLYRVTEIAAVPLPAGLPLLLGALTPLWLCRRRHRKIAF